MSMTAATAAWPRLPNALAQSIVNEWQGSILVLDENLLITFANQYFSDFVGVSRITMERQPLEYLLSSPEVSKFLRGVQRGSRQHNLKVNCDIPGVGERSLLLSGTLLANAKHKAVLLGLTDISNQSLSNSPRSAIEALDISMAPAPLPRLPNALGHGILNEWPESILVLDENLLITFANQYFSDFVGVPRITIEGQPLGHLLSSPGVSKFLRRVQRGSRQHNLKVECDIPGVGERTLLLSGTPLANAKHKAVLLGFTDISNQSLSNSVLSHQVEMAQRSEKGQRKEADLLRSIMESSDDGIFVANAEGKCVLWNSACEQILGLNAKSLQNLKREEWSEEFGAFLGDKVTPYPVKDLPLSRALAGESCDNVEVWIKNKSRPDGLWINMTARPLTGGQDGAVATLRDITFAKNTREVLAAQALEVARSNRELEQFAYVAAHDLQEPLRMVSSYVQLLARRYRGKLDTEADEFIEFATDGARRMSHLINDLLTYSRIGRGDVVEEMVDCERILKQVLENLSQKNVEAGAEITHDRLPQVKANEIQITQVFQNLIDNAIKFRSKEAPRIHISAREEGNKWIFSVADNGIGIDPAYKERVFVIFQRLNSREDYDGTGIGLAVVKRIVEKHEGEVWVEPNPGSGTVIYFSWP